jgi:vanillate/3-O-methylgallate O-demethylase
MREEQMRSLQDKLDGIPDLVDYFYNDTLAPHAKHRADLVPIPPEFTNWRDEQRSWRETAVLFDQSHHMPELFLSGPDALRLLKTVGINSFENIAPGRVKQLIGCAYDGHVIGESVAYCHAEDSFELVSGMTLQNWVHYLAETGGYDVKVGRDLNTSDNPTGRRMKFRYQLDGPNAEKIFREVVEGEVPDIPFFRTGQIRIAGCDVLALRHGMAGHFGVELSGAYDDGEKVRAAIVEAGAPHGLRQAGSRAYFSTLGESGWMPYPLPAIYTDDRMRGFREWLPADGWELRQQLGGSFRSPRIEDYYVTPWDLGLERLLRFDHDFIGREALEQMADGEHRTKVTLVWDKDDVMRVQRSLLEEEIPYKYLDLPVAHYSFQHTDRVLDGDRLVGLATYTGYTVNEPDILSLAIVDASHAEPGTEVTIVWGEPDGGSRKPHVERHRQLTVRATVAPAPYAQAVRQFKAGAAKPTA